MPARRILQCAMAGSSCGVWRSALRPHAAPRIIALRTRMRGAMRPENRRGPCAAALLERAWQEAADSGADTVRASTIDLNNESSLRMAKAVGGRIKCAYGIYLCKISPESA